MESLNTNGDVSLSELLKDCNSATTTLEQSVKQMKGADDTGEVPSLLKVNSFLSIY